VIYIIEQIESIKKTFQENGYITDPSTLTALHLIQVLQKPLLLEGPAGVGKTEIAKTLAKALDTKLIRLQCYEGLDVNNALYEWNYAKQMIYIRMTETEHDEKSVAEKEADIFSDKFLLTRPLLEAFMEKQAPPVLLIDEIDRADEAFEAFLLEALAEFQITIPELGTIQAEHRPYVILTSNRTRELSDALRRRCLYQWISYPDFKKEVTILRSRLPHIDEALAEQITNVMQRVRQMTLQKIPGVSESLDWAEALVSMHQRVLDKEISKQTLGCFIKNHDDWEMISREIDQGTFLHSNQ